MEIFLNSIKEIQLKTRKISNEEADFSEEEIIKKIQSLFDEGEIELKIIDEIRKRPYFERPFYGWYLPINGYHKKSSLDTVKNKNISFTATYFPKEINHCYNFQTNSLLLWLSSTENYSENLLHKIYIPI